jgi:hypothetical protein
MKIKYSCMFFIFILILGCATTPATPPKTQLEIREFQTREYNTGNTKMVMKSLLNVLQDDGYIIKVANVDLGLLSASKEINVENKGQAFLLTLLAGQNARWKKNSEIDCSGNVTQMGKVCRVRVNFQIRTMDNKGGLIDVKPIDDPLFYQKFFATVDKGIFIGKQKL